MLKEVEMHYYRWQRQQRQQWLCEATFFESVVRRFFTSRTAFFAAAWVLMVFMLMFFRFVWVLKEVEMH
jgi:hypothetical protein